MRRFAITVMLLAVAANWPRLAVAEPIADFYRGKVITLLISAPPGTGYDAYARLMARHLGNHIPGNPTIIAKNHPAAGGVVLLNSAYNTGARDGTLLFTLHFNLPLYQAMGGQGVRFDAAKFIGLGRLLASNVVIGVAANSKSGVRNLSDAMQREALIGSAGATSNSTVFPTIINNLLGAKFKVVSGYEGEGGVFLAMERGEIDGFGSYSYLTFKSIRPDYLEKKLFFPIVQWGAKREEAWSDVPTAIDLAQTPIDKKAMELVSAGADIGFSYFMPPQTPGDRVLALRHAFTAMINDPAFLADAERSKLYLRPASAEDVEKIVGNVLAAPPEVIDRLTHLMGSSTETKCENYTKAEFCSKGAAQ
jgi:tripartite-type tricarboxylate transporter receptor subunit TctC